MPPRQPVKNLSRAFQPPAQRIEQIDLCGQQRQAKQQHTDVAKKNNRRREQITLRRDIGLPRFQHAPGQRHVKRIRRAHGQVEPDQVIRPIPKEMAEGEHHDDQHGVEREEIRGQRDDEVAFGDD